MNYTWKESLRQRNFVTWLSFALITIVLMGLFVEIFFQNVILNKPGVLLNDFVLEYLNPIDWSMEIMALLYSALLISGVFNYNKPYAVTLAFSTYAIVNVIRMGTIYYFTLEAPKGVIPLSDPFLALIVYDRSDFVKDLFFSGHISSMCCLVAVETNRKIKIILIGLSIIMAILILSQHVHYTIDVIFAPIITFSVYYLIKRYGLKMPQPGSDKSL